MAVRNPLKVINENNDYNLQVMTNAERNEIRSQAVYEYGTQPSVTLLQPVNNSNSSNAIGTLVDTRMTAGAASVSNTAFPNEATTAEPGEVSTSYKKILQNVTANLDEPEDTDSKRFPVYLDSGNNVRAMSQTDFIDTFIKPAINTLVGSGDQPGTYRIHTSTSLTDHTLVKYYYSGRFRIGPVFQDTRANTSLYTKEGIEEDVDQETVVTNYYIFKTNAGIEPTYTLPLYIDADNNLRQYTKTAFDALLKEYIRWAAVNLADYKIRYQIGGTGTNKGSGMVDTKLNGAGNYQTNQVGDNYYAQEFPNGTSETINTYRLKIYKAA